MDKPPQSKTTDGKLNRTNSEKKKLSRKMVSFYTDFQNVISWLVDPQHLSIAGFSI